MSQREGSAWLSHEDEIMFEKKARPETPEVEVFSSKMLSSSLCETAGAERTLWKVCFQIQIMIPDILRSSSSQEKHQHVTSLSFSQSQILSLVSSWLIISSLCCPTQTLSGATFLTRLIWSLTCSLQAERNQTQREDGQTGWAASSVTAWQRRHCGGR